VSLEFIGRRTPPAIVCANVRRLCEQTYQTGQTDAEKCATNQATEQPERADNRGLEMSSDESTRGNLSAYRQSLGVCWIVYGIFRLILGICLILYMGTATVMFGALLGRVPDAFSLMAEFHVFYAMIVVLSFVCGLIGLLAGLALAASQGPGRKLALAAAILSVSDLPFGTTLGIFTLIALLPLRGGFAAIRA
jgi:hypothetical protein